MFANLAFTGQTISFFIISLFVIACGVLLLSLKKVIYMAMAITIMILFAIMLTKHDAVETQTGLTAHPVWAAITSIGFGGIIIYVLKFSGMTLPQPGKDSPWVGQNNVKLIGDALFNQYVIPFELVSVVLIVALVGAITLANKEDKEDA